MDNHIVRLSGAHDVVVLCISVVQFNSILSAYTEFEFIVTEPPNTYFPAVFIVIRDVLVTVSCIVSVSKFSN